MKTHGVGNCENCDCPKCGKTFANRPRLNRHLKTHDTSSIKDHLCPICGKGFNRSDNMISHLRKGHRDVVSKVVKRCFLIKCQLCILFIFVSKFFFITKITKRVLQLELVVYVEKSSKPETQISEDI